MSGLENIVTLNALASGTVNVHVDKAPSATLSSATTARIAGTVTLSGNFNVSPSGTPVKNTSVKILWEASVTLSGNSVVIFGETVPNELAARNFVAECVYDGAAWVVNILPDFAGVGIIGEDRLAAKSVTLAKMASGTTGSILAYNLLGNIEEVDMATDGKLLIGVTGGKGYNAAVLSGDATLSTVGVLSLASGSVDTAELVNASVTTDKIEDAAVTAAKLDSNSNKAQITIPISFEDASELGVLEFKMCFDCTVDAIHGTVTKPFVSTGTHIFKDDTGTVLTGSQIDMSSALTLGNIVSTTPTANNSFSAGDVIKIETSTSGADGGKSVINLCCTKL